jgi:ribosomal protein S18 acetylase RimI-like enzyme
VVSVLDDAYASSWFTPAIGPEDLSRSDVDTWIALRDGTPVGAAVVRTNQDAVWIAGLGTSTQHRGSGVARSMLCHLMRYACGRNSGVILLSPSEDDLVLRWTRGLGFWTYRSWAQYTLHVDLTGP